MAEKVQQLIVGLAEELLAKLTVIGQVTAQEVDGAVHVTIESDDQGILIGRHGKNLESIQILLGQLVYKKLGTWVRIVVSVGDYRARREEQLKAIAESAAERVLSMKEPVVLEYLTPSERRVIHMMFAEHPEVLSESEGEGRDRRLVIKLRS